MTNLDRIKNMTADEMAELLKSASCKSCAYRGHTRCSFRPCEEGIKKWLEQEAENE